MYDGRDGDGVPAAAAAMVDLNGVVVVDSMDMALAYAGLLLLQNKPTKALPNPINTCFLVIISAVVVFGLIFLALPTLIGSDDKLNPEAIEKEQINIRFRAERKYNRCILNNNCKLINQKVFSLLTQSYCVAGA